MISIIAPVYQVEQHLFRFIESIINQTFSDFECILVDDGSQDRCSVICDAYAKKDKRVRVIHKENGGLSDARNVGLNAAKGKYILFVASDGWIHPQLLVLSYTAIIDTEYDFVSFEFAKIHNYAGSYAKYDINSELLSVRTYDSGFIINNLYNRFQQEIGVEACKKLYKREIFDSIRFSKGIIHEDDDVFLDILLRTKKISIMKLLLYFYYMSESSIMRSGLSDREFIRMDIDIKNIRRVNEEGIISQKKLCSIPCFEHYMGLYYLIKEKYPELKKSFQKYRQEYLKNIIYMLRNKNLSRAFAVLAVTFFVSPRLAKKQYDHLI